MNIGLSLGPQKCFNNSPAMSSAVRISRIFFSTAQTKMNFGLPGIKAILSKSAFLIKLVSSFSLALDLSLNPEIMKPSSNKVSLSRFLGTVFSFGEGRGVTYLIHCFSAFFDWICLVLLYGCDLLCLWTGRLRLKKLARLL